MIKSRGKILKEFKRVKKSDDKASLIYNASNDETFISIFTFEKWNTSLMLVKLM